MTYYGSNELVSWCVLNSSRELGPKGFLLANEYFIHLLFFIIIIIIIIITINKVIRQHFGKCLIDVRSSRLPDPRDCSNIIQSFEKYSFEHETEIYGLVKTSQQVDYFQASSSARSSAGPGLKLEPFAHTLPLRC